MKASLMKGNMMADLFIYGTLRDRDVCEKVLGRSVSADDITPATAADFAIFKVADVSYPCLLPREGAIAEGARLSGLSAHDIAILDRFEGVNYRRVPIAIIVADGTALQSEYYQPNDALQTDGAWDLALWQKQGKQAFLSRDFDLAGVRVPSHV